MWPQPETVTSLCGCGHSRSVLGSQRAVWLPPPPAVWRRRPGSQGGAALHSSSRRLRTRERGETKSEHPGERSDRQRRLALRLWGVVPRENPHPDVLSPACSERMHNPMKTRCSDERT